MTTRRPSKRRTTPSAPGRALLYGVVLAVLLAAGGYLTVRVREQQQDATLPDLTGTARTAGGTRSATAHPTRPVTATFSYTRLGNPARTIVRDAGGDTAATFTDGARTAVLTGPSRTFSEPRTTRAKVVTDSWVRLLPHTWKRGAQHTAWFRKWFTKYHGSRSDDLFAVAFQYGDGAPTAKKSGRVYRGDAAFGPVSDDVRYDLRLEQSDFYDYLGVSWRFEDGVVEYPEAAKIRSIDCSGFIRTVFGYRGGYPLNPTDASHGTGLPRTAYGIGSSDVGRDIVPLRRTGSTAPLRMYAHATRLDKLQPGDLLFWKLDRRTGPRLDHVGIYLGLDTDGHPRFVSSRKEANGPTMGDMGGAARLDGDGMYATYLTSAKRL
jgi:cell wall-associated NlpC family hydrolase